MRIQPISKVYSEDSVYKNSGKNVAKNENISFKEKFLKIEKIEKWFSYKGIKTDFCNKQYAANCIYRVTRVFENLFGTNSLPKNIKFENLKPRFYGLFTPDNEIVKFNKKNPIYDSPFLLYKNGVNGHPSNLLEAQADFMEKHPYVYYNLPLVPKISPDLLRKSGPDAFSSYHPAHIFVHEFGHAAHWKHLEKRLGTKNALDYWMYLCGTNIPDPVERLRIRYNLSAYAVDANDLAEFVAEKLSKDVCEFLSYFDWKLKDIPDVHYENIFSRKWDNKYASPEAYMDYYMQKVWNGDRDGSEKVVKDIEKFLRQEELKDSSREGKNPAKRLRTNVQTQKQEMLQEQTAVRKHQAVNEQTRRQEQLQSQKRSQEHKQARPGYERTQNAGTQAQTKESFNIPYSPADSKKSVKDSLTEMFSIKIHKKQNTNSHKTKNKSILKSISNTFVSLKESTEDMMDECFDLLKRGGRKLLAIRKSYIEKSREARAKREEAMEMLSYYNYGRESKSIFKIIGEFFTGIKDSIADKIDDINMRSYRRKYEEEEELREKVYDYFSEIKKAMDEKTEQSTVTKSNEEKKESSSSSLTGFLYGISRSIPLIGNIGSDSERIAEREKEDLSSRIQRLLQ